MNSPGSKVYLMEEPGFEPKFKPKAWGLILYYYTMLVSFDYRDFNFTLLILEWTWSSLKS